MSWRSTPRSILIDVGYFSIHLNNAIANPTKQDVYQAEWIASSDTWRSDNFIWLLHRQTRERVTIIDLHSSRFPREREREREKIFLLSHCPRENGDHPLVAYVSWFSSCGSLNIVHSRHSMHSTVQLLLLVTPALIALGLLGVAALTNYWTISLDEVRFIDVRSRFYLNEF